MRFLHESTAVRVLFGAGRRREAAAELARLGERPLLIAGASAARAAPDVHGELSAAAAALVAEVRQHVPVADARAARELAAEAHADCLVALGGGSAIGLAKAVALTSGLPILAIPTTYSGSETTPVWGVTEDGAKTTGQDPAVAPRVVLYDPELTYGLPPGVTAASGMNAVAHGAEALWAAGRTPASDALAERGIALLADGLAGAVREGADADARARALAGAWLAGTAFAAAGSGFHHRLCHVLGGRFGLPHAETHAALLPRTAALATRHVPTAGAAISRALGGDLSALAARLGAPTSLAPYGFTAADAAALADDLDPVELGAPFPLTREDVRELLCGAAAN